MSEHFKYTRDNSPHLNLWQRFTLNHPFWTMIGIPVIANAAWFVASLLFAHK